MAEKDWAAILKDEDRIIANSDRRFGITATPWRV